MIKYLKYSGASMIISVNPLWWPLLPKARREPNESWAGPHERTYSAQWLFLTFRIWFDDGSY